MKLKSENLRKACLCPQPGVYTPNFNNDNCISNHTTSETDPKAENGLTVLLVIPSLPPLSRKLTPQNYVYVTFNLKLRQ